MNKLSIATLSLLGGLLLSTANMQAQKHNRPLTLEEYTAGSPKYIYPKHVWGLQWWGDNILTLEQDAIKVRSIKGNDNQVLLSLEDCNRLMNEAGLSSSLKRIPSYTALPSKLLKLEAQGVIAIVNPESKQLVARFDSQDKATSPKPYMASLNNEQYTALAYVKEHNLYIQTAEGKHLKLSQDGSEQIVYGQSVHQNEFGINGGLFWSPSGKRLAFYRMDQSMVAPYPILHIDQRRPYGEAQYYPMAGTDLHHVSLGIYDMERGTTVYLKTPNPSKTYLTNITWHPDGKEIYVVELNREQTSFEVVAYDPNTGSALRKLFSEHNAVYAEPLHQLAFLPGQSNLFVWQSRRDGYNHLYLYDTTGKLIRQLTKGSWEVTDFHGFSQDAKTLFYTSTEGSPLGRRLYSRSISGKGTSKCLTPESGWHRASLSASKQYVLDRFERIDVGSQISIKDLSGKTVSTLLEANNPDADYLSPKIELGTIKAADGTTDLHYRLIKPYNFDASKQYPAIVYVYNGPHAQLVQNRYRAAARGWELNMANLGYIIFTVDGRGSAYRGSAFEQVIHRQLGKNEMADQMRGVDYLKSQPYVDAKRLGVYGWSYGGFMTTNLMLTHNDVFKVGVAGGPVIDWARYEAMYGERYMDTPQENPEGYKAANLLLRAKDLKGRLLLIHGSIDPVVIWQHSLLFLQSAVAAGTHPDYMVYPEHKHNVTGPDRVHLNQVITRYFQDHL